MEKELEKSCLRKETFPPWVQYHTALDICQVCAKEVGQRGGEETYRDNFLRVSDNIENLF